MAGVNDNRKSRAAVAERIQTWKERGVFNRKLQKENRLKQKAEYKGKMIKIDSMFARVERNR